MTHTNDPDTEQHHDCQGVAPDLVAEAVRLRLIRPQEIAAFLTGDRDNDSTDNGTEEAP